jgi:hypothetical protein
MKPLVFESSALDGSERSAHVIPSVAPGMRRLSRAANGNLLLVNPENNSYRSRQFVCSSFAGRENKDLAVIISSVESLTVNIWQRKGRQENSEEEAGNSRVITFLFVRFQLSPFSVSMAAFESNERKCVPDLVQLFIYLFVPFLCFFLFSFCSAYFIRCSLCSFLSDSEYNAQCNVYCRAYRRDVGCSASLPPPPPTFTAYWWSGLE